MTRRSALPLALASISALAACQPADAPPAAKVEAEGRAATGAAVQASGAWCRASPNGARTGACYVTLTASADDRLTAAATAASSGVEIHDMSTEGGVMRMTPIQGGLPLPAGVAVSLAPGGRHLMLTQLAQPLEEGETVDLTLSFQTAAPLSVQAPVASSPPQG